MNNGYSPILENKNLNDIVKTGIYNVDPTCTNIPSGTWYFVISFVHSYDNQHMTQVAFPMINSNAPTISIRCKSAGTWYAWRTL
jgi:hypothetical protein